MCGMGCRVVQNRVQRLQRCVQGVEGCSVIYNGGYRGRSL